MYRIRTRLPYEALSWGADPEFELIIGGDIVRAAGALMDDVALPWGEIGVDGAGGPLELRPSPSPSPYGLVMNVGRLLMAVPKLAGGIPSTVSEVYPLGGHLHIGLSSLEAHHFREDIVRAIDGELGELFCSLNSPVRERNFYGYRGDWRPQSWGLEYRTPPAAIWSHPQVAVAFLEAVERIAGTLLRMGEWDPAKDPLWPAMKERAEKAARFARAYGGRLHWGAWEKFVGELHFPYEPRVEYMRPPMADPEFEEDIKRLLKRLGLPRVLIIPLRGERGDYASNVPGYGVWDNWALEYGEFPRVLVVSLRFRTDPAFRREEMPKLEAAIRRLFNRDDAGRLIRQAIDLDGEWPAVPPPPPIAVAEAEEEEDVVEV